MAYFTVEYTFDLGSFGWATETRKVFSEDTHSIASDLEEMAKHHEFIGFFSEDREEAKFLPAQRVVVIECTKIPIDD